MTKQIASVHFVQCANANKQSVLAFWLIASNKAYHTHAATIKRAIHDNVIGSADRP